MKPWEKDLPRAQWNTFKKIHQSQPWFEVVDVLPKIYAIYEPYQFQEVISYLIIGEQKALLWDSGTGIGDMKQLVNELTKKEVMVLNSHCHFDHIGGNHLFSDVVVFDHPDMISIMEHGVSQKLLDEQLGADTYSDNSPVAYHKVIHRRCNYRTCKENDVFDLGRRRWKVIHTPGHSSDSIMLVNEEEKVLMTGDSYYPATLYCFDESLFDEYVSTMRTCANQYSEYVLLTSHNEPKRDGLKLKEAACFLEMIQKGELPFEKKNDLKYYEWKNYSILKK